MSEIVQPNKTKIITGIKVHEREFKFRLVDQESLSKYGVAGVVARAVLQQNTDQNNLLWYALLCLAKDVYSRFPQGSREFERLVNELGLTIITANGEDIDASKDLEVDTPSIN